MSHESATLDRGQEYRVTPRYEDNERQPIINRIKALEQQAAGHENIARGLRGEIKELKRQAGIAS